MSKDPIRVGSTVNVACDSGMGSGPYTTVSW